MNTLYLMHDIRAVSNKICTLIGAEAFLCVPCHRIGGDDDETIYRKLQFSNLGGFTCTKNVIISYTYIGGSKIMYQFVFNVS